MTNPDWEDVDPDSLMKAARQHDWMMEPRFKRMFEDIEDKLQGVLGSGQYDWVDRRVFDAVFDRSTLMSLHKLMQAGEIETVDYPTHPDVLPHPSLGQLLNSQYQFSMIGHSSP